jgi:hypothetical protein
MSLSALGAFNRWIVVVLVDARAKPPQPEAAATVNVTALVVAVPPVVGAITSQAAAGAVDVSTVNGVPPLAEEETAIVCAVPGV